MGPPLPGEGAWCPPAHVLPCPRFQGDSRLEQSGCDHHCVDENIERRNHYLDLAGIENYTSQFGPGKGALPAPVGGLGVGGIHCTPWAGGRHGFDGTGSRVLLEEMTLN